MASKRDTPLLQIIRESVFPFGDDRISDRELLRRFAEQRDENAFTALVRRHGAMVLGVGKRVLRRHQDAEDVCQATFLLLARKASALPWRDSVVNWLYGAAYRLALQTRAAAHRRDVREKIIQPKATPDAMAEIGLRDFQDTLDRELTRLPQKYASLLLLCCLEGRTRDEAARSLGLPLPTVKSRLEEGRELLRRRLARRGVELTTVLASVTICSQSASAALPAILARATSDAAVRIYAGESIAGLVSASVMALTTKGIQTMFLAKFKVATVMLLAVGIAATGMVSALQNLTVRAQADAPPKAQTPGAEKKPMPDAKPTAKVLAALADDSSDTVTYRGRVIGPNGQPVSGAKLYSEKRSDNSQEASDYSPAYATTGPDGKFEFSVPNSKFGDYAFAIAASAPSFGAGWTDRDLEVGKTSDLTIQLVADDLPISGQIVDLDGKPVPNTTVRVVKISAAADEQLEPWLKAAADERLSSQNRAPDLESKFLPRLTRALSPTVSTDAEGRFQLNGIGRNRLVAAQLDGPTIARQDLHILTAPIGKIDIAVDRQTNVGNLGGLIVYYGATFQHVAAAARPPIIGVVRDKDTGKPLAGMTIQSHMRQIGPRRFEFLSPRVRTKTDAEGRYRLTGMPRGADFWIQAIPHDRPDHSQNPQLNGQPYLPSTVRIPDGVDADGAAVDFNLKCGVWIEGKITDSVTGKPLVRSLAYHPNSDNPNLSDYQEFIRSEKFPVNRSNDDGAYRVVGMPGPGLIVVFHEMYDYLLAPERDDEFAAKEPYVNSALFHGMNPAMFHALARIDPAKGADTLMRDVTLVPAWRFTCTVRGPDGEPLNGAQGIFLGDHRACEQNLKSAEFNVKNFNPRKPRPLLFQHLEKGLVGVAQPPQKNGEAITVRLAPAAVVTGRLVGSDGKPLVGIKINAWFTAKDNPFLLGVFVPELFTDKEGRFRMTPLLPGFDYHLSDGQGGEFRFSSDIPLGQTKDLGNVRMKRAESNNNVL